MRGWREWAGRCGSIAGQSTRVWEGAIAGGATAFAAPPHDIVEAARSRNQTILARANPRSNMPPVVDLTFK